MIDNSLLDLSFDLKNQEEVYFTDDEFSKDFEFNFYSTEDE